MFITLLQIWIIINVSTLSRGDHVTVCRKLNTIPNQSFHSNRQCYQQTVLVERSDEKIKQTDFDEISKKIQG